MKVGGREKGCDGRCDICSIRQVLKCSVADCADCLPLSAKWEECGDVGELSVLEPMYREGVPGKCD